MARLSPSQRSAVRSIVQGSMSRRAFLGGAGGLGLSAFLAACGTAGLSSGPRPSPAVDKSATEKVVNWANWAAYLDYDSDLKGYPTLKAFTKKTGIKATYDEAIEDNDSYYGKVQGQLRNGDDIGKDIVVFTDWMASRMIRQGYVQELDHAKMPNAGNILKNLADVDFDKGRKYSLTWQSGYAGLAWDKRKLPQGLRNVSDLWNPALKGRVEVLSEMRDTIGLIMLEQGVDISGDFIADDFSKALEVLEKQVGSGQIRQVKGNSYREDLVSGDAIAVIAWSGDITSLNFESGDHWEFRLPDAGGTLWSDNLMVPIGSPHKANAEALMNYYYDPEVAATVAAYVNYICPVQGAQEAMQSIDPSLVDNPNIFPTPADLTKAHVFRTLQPAEETEFSTDFQKVLGL
ncbi:PotD/PotF family extracellular solute-binding protein [Spongisporangium articulatum]|uniref:PotD/PotF family extracellular solute-binding protein n=1 Tax=Spongisporangium articulatum TaxID=3362603 RepID=A0ABW8AMZ2_9ACTN